jgi:hypothetical protein
MDTGSPIWIADANVVFALTGSKVSQPFLYAWYSGLALAACARGAPGLAPRAHVRAGRALCCPVRVLVRPGLG